MSVTLTDTYRRIAEEHRKAFLQNQIETDSHWGKRIEGVTLQIDLSPNVNDHLDIIIQTLHGMEPDALLTVDRMYRHISFRQVVYWNDDFSGGSEAVWKKIENDFLEKFRALDGKFRSFPVTFFRFIPMTSAIIWTAYDEHDDMNRLRDGFAGLLPFPKTTKENRIIHTSIARYKNRFRNPQRVYDFLKEQSQKVTMTVDTIILRKENIYPSVDTTELARISLEDLSR